MSFNKEKREKEKKENVAATSGHYDMFKEVRNSLSSEATDWRFGLPPH